MESLNCVDWREVVFGVVLSERLSNDSASDLELFSGAETRFLPREHMAAYELEWRQAAYQREDVGTLSFGWLSVAWSDIILCIPSFSGLTSRFVFQELVG